MTWLRSLRRAALGRRALQQAPGPPDKRCCSPGDSPIEHPAQDLLHRSDYARDFANQVLALDASKGLVVAVTGAWGAGKSSFVNMVTHSLKGAGIDVLAFNPWMFSGAAQLVDAFFAEVSAQMKVKRGLEDIGAELEAYGECFSWVALVPGVGSVLEGARQAASALGKRLVRRRGGIGPLKAKVVGALAKLPRPLVVVVDDIDRLTSAEIRDVFRLVRLTASFPNVIYLVAYDRRRVESALNEDGVPGRDYLEKIVQVALDLPATSGNVLVGQLTTAIDQALIGVADPGPFDEQVWPDILIEVILPLVDTMRGVRRYAAAVQGSIPVHGGRVAVADALALEAVRVFMPDVYAMLHTSVDGLTRTHDWSSGRHDEPPETQAQIDRLIETAGANAEVVRAMIRRLFPAAERCIGGSSYGSDWKARWLRERRVAHEDVLRFCLERVPSAQLAAFAAAEKAWRCMESEADFADCLRSLPPDRLEEVVQSLLVFEGEFKPSHVVPGTAVLLNLLGRMPERPRGMYEVDARLVVGGAVCRLLRSLGNPEGVEEAVREAMPMVAELSARLEMVRIVGYQEGAGHKLVTEDAAAAFEREWVAAVRGASAETLAADHDLFRVLSAVRRLSGQAVMLPLGAAASAQFTLAALRSARGEARSQYMGNRAVTRSYRYPWDALAEVFGDAATLRSAVDALRSADLEGSREFVELADRYISGWRPNDHDDD